MSVTKLLRPVCLAFPVLFLPGFFSAIPYAGSEVESVPVLKNAILAESHKKDYWRVEDQQERERWPEYKTIPAATEATLTPSLIQQDPVEHVNWSRSHGGLGNTRYSSLNQINRTNVHTLKPTWVYRSGDGEGGIQCNPVIAEGLVFTPTPGEAVVAIDAVSGKEVWRFHPGSRPAFRGLDWVAADGDHPSRLFFNSGNFLWCLDAQTGLPYEPFGDMGKVETGHFRVAPVRFQDLILIAGYEKDAFAIHIETGERVWTFHTPPHAGEEGFETWDRVGQGANCWSGTALDDQRGVFYLSTGSPKPNFVGVGHRGRNLYSNSLLALDASNGEKLWHFQEIRHDIWDLDIPAPPVLVSVKRNGSSYDAVAAVSKMGNTLLLDRLSGEPLFPFRLRRAPVSRLPGELTWPYQPDLELPEPFARQTFSEKDITDRTPEAAEYVGQVVRNANHGWFEPFEPGRRTIFYGVHGGAEWTGACFDPRTNQLFVSSNELPWIVNVIPYQAAVSGSGLNLEGKKLYATHCGACHGYNREGIGAAPPLMALSYRLSEDEVRALLKVGRGQMPVAQITEEEEIRSLLDFLFDKGIERVRSEEQERPTYTATLQKLLDHEGYPGVKPPWGTLNAIQLNTGKINWQVPLGEHPALTSQGSPITGTENFGGPIVTAGGLVFCGGTRDKKIRAFDSDTGQIKWEWQLPFGNYCPPATYEIGGKQYLLVPATGGGKLSEGWFDLPSNHPFSIDKGGEGGDAWVSFSL